MTLRWICFILILVKRIKKTNDEGKGFWWRYQHLILSLLVVVAASVVFAFRYPPAFTDANFYAEDGKVFTNAVITKNPVQAALTGFNGYLVVGQFLMAEVAVDAQQILGMHFYEVPVIVAGISCLFLGLTVSLPFILFRRELGTIIALLLVMLGALTPLPSFDYAIIGTIGNLKFAFLYWGVLFVLYRIYHSENKTKVIISDTVLLFSVLTYAPVVFLLPFAFWPYRKRIIKAIQDKTVTIFKSFEIVSLLVLCSVASIYVAYVLIRGIPPIPGYLDGPYNSIATPKIAFHATWYALMFPFVDKIRDSMVIGMLLLTTYVGVRYKANRLVFVLASWAIITATTTFVANRTGIASLLMQYAPGPDHFFYGQRLVFLFLLAWMFSSYFNKQKIETRLVWLYVILLFTLSTLRYTGSFGSNSITYDKIGDARALLTSACKTQSTTEGNITFDLYPSNSWQWNIKKTVACE